MHNGRPIITYSAMGRTVKTNDQGRSRKRSASHPPPNDRRGIVRKRSTGGQNRDVDKHNDHDSEDGRKRPDQHIDRPGRDCGRRPAAGIPIPLTHKEVEIVVASTNVGYSQVGLAHRQGLHESTPLAKITKEYNLIDCTIGGICEHKMGKHDYHFIPKLNSRNLRWLGWPGKKKGQQGIGFFLHVEAVVQYTHFTECNANQTASIIVSYKGCLVAAILTYWICGCTLEMLAQNEEDTKLHMLKLQPYRPHVCFLMGDLNVDMKADNAKKDRLLSFMTDLGMKRIDMIGSNADWVTRPRTGTHIDCLAVKAMVDCTRVSEWNHLWAGDDHTSLGTKMLLRVSVGDEEEAEVELPLAVKYRYKNFSEDEKRRYGHTTDEYMLAGIEERIELHLTMANNKERIRQVQKDALVATDACLLEAALQKSADMHLKKHRVSNKARKPHSRLSLKEIAVKYKELLWEKMSELRSTSKKGQRPGKTLPSILTADGQIKYGSAQVREEVKKHHEKVSEHNLTDTKFDTDITLARQVEEAVEEIRAENKDISDKGEVKHGAASGPDQADQEVDELIDRVCRQPPTKDEFLYGLEKLSTSEDGAPSCDGIMAWMILIAGTRCKDTIFKLFVLMWKWATIPECWKIALVKYIKKSGDALDMDISQHRPITLKAILGKLFSRVMFIRLKIILEPWIPFPQLGYQAELDSYSVLWAVRRLFQERTETGNGVWALLCDWAKAYDKVWRAMVLLLIHAMGITGELWILIDKWIHETVLIAFFNGVATDQYTVDAGLGQGCVLSALLFLMYIRTLTSPAPPMKEGYKYKNLITRLHEDRLPQAQGVTTSEMGEVEIIQAILAADDTTMLAPGQEQLEHMCGVFTRWKKVSRAESNVKKFQLLAQKTRKRQPTAEDPVGHVKAHNKGGTIKLPDVNEPTTAVPTVKLLGGQLRSTQNKGDLPTLLWKSYVPKVAAQQLTLGRIMHQLGHAAALEYARATSQTAVITAAAVDYDFLQHVGILDRLQRALWCGGLGTATGLHRTTSSMVAHRIIGQLQWSRRVEVGRVKAWVRLLHHLKKDSWPTRVANACHDKAVEELGQGKVPLDPYVRTIHRTLVKWDSADGLLKPMPRGKTITSSTKLKAEESMLIESRKKGKLRKVTAPSENEGADPRPQQATTMRDIEHCRDDIARMTEDWKKRGYQGGALINDLSCDMLNRVKKRPRPIGSESSGGETDDGSGTDSDDGTEPDDEGSSDERVAIMEEKRTLAATARAWNKKLMEAAEAEQETEWAREQEAYAPKNDKLGRGDAALWLELHPVVDGKIAKDRWGILHLVQTRNVRYLDDFLQLLAGCNPHLKATLCKIKVPQAWKRPKDFTDADRLQAVECPCGAGRQDSLHILECKDTRMQSGRKDVTDRAKYFFATQYVEAKERLQSIRMKDVVTRRDEAKKRGLKEGTFTLTQWQAHVDELEQWTRADPKDLLRFTLGATPTAVFDEDRSVIINDCMHLWVQMANTWPEINRKA